MNNYNEYNDEEEDEDLQEPPILSVYVNYSEEFFKVVNACDFLGALSLRFLPNGLRLVVDDGAESQCNAYFPCEFFAEYTIRTDQQQVVVNVDAKTFMQTSNSFRDKNFGTRLIQQNEGDQLQVIIESTKLRLAWMIATLEDSDPCSIVCDNDQVAARVLFSPKFLHDLITDLHNEAETARFEFYADKVFIEAECDLIYQATEVRPVQNNKEDLLILSASEYGCVVRYKTKQLKMMLNLLQLAKKAALRVDNCGVLCVKIQLQQSENVTTYTEFMFHRTITAEEEENIIKDSAHKPSPNLFEQQSGSGTSTSTLVTTNELQSHRPMQVSGSSNISGSPTVFDNTNLYVSTDGAMINANANFYHQPTSSSALTVNGD